MSAQGKKLRLADGNVYVHRCPGCKAIHAIPVGAIWKFDGKLDRPTVVPSVKVSSNVARNAEELIHSISYTTCHYIISGGTIFFCTDSLHELAGQSVPLPDFEAKDD